MQGIKYKGQTVYPSKVVCIGRNYVEHIKELNNETPDTMVVFNKPNSAISDSLLFISESTRFEGEICFLIEKNMIAGIGFGLDLTKADVQEKMKVKGWPWERAKAFNGSAVLSEFIPFKGDLSTVTMKLSINEKLSQEASYELMIYKPQEILEELLTFMSLEDGDIIMSGTPKGVATYQRDDIFHAEIFSCGDKILDSVFKVR